MYLPSLVMYNIVEWFQKTNIGGGDGSGDSGSDGGGGGGGGGTSSSSSSSSSSSTSSSCSSSSSSSSSTMNTNNESGKRGNVISSNNRRSVCFCCTNRHFCLWSQVGLLYQLVTTVVNKYGALVEWHRCDKTEVLGLNPFPAPLYLARLK